MFFAIFADGDGVDFFLFCIFFGDRSDDFFVVFDVGRFAIRDQKNRFGIVAQGSFESFVGRGSPVEVFDSIFEKAFGFGEVRGGHRNECFWGEARGKRGRDAGILVTLEANDLDAVGGIHLREDFVGGFFHERLIFFHASRHIEKDDERFRLGDDAEESELAVAGGFRFLIFESLLGQGGGILELLNLFLCGFERLLVLLDLVFEFGRVVDGRRRGAFRFQIVLEQDERQEDKSTHSASEEIDCGERKDIDFSGTASHGLGRQGWGEIHYLARGKTDE